MGFLGLARVSGRSVPPIADIFLADARFLGGSSGRRPTSNPAAPSRLCAALVRRQLMSRLVIFQAVGQYNLARFGEFPPNSGWKYDSPEQAA